MLRYIKSGQRAVARGGSGVAGHILLACAASLCLASCGSSGVKIARSEASASQSLDGTAKRALAISDDLIRQMSAKCDDSIAVMGSNFIVTEFKGKAVITSNVEVSQPSGVQQLNGDFDEQIRVIYTVTSDYARQYAIRGFLQDDPVSEDVVAQPTFGMGPQRPPDFNVVHTRWLQPGIGDLGIASLIWNAKDGKLSLGGLEMNEIMGWNGGINTDRTPFDPIKPVGSWTTDAPVLNLPVVVKNHLGDNGVSVHQLSCEQLENPIMSAANLMASVGGQQAIDEFIPPAGTPGADGTRLPPATVEQIAPAVDGVRQMFYKAAGLAAPAATAVSNPTAGQRVAITNGPTDVTVDGSAQTPQAAPAPVAAAPTPVGAAPATRAPSGPPEPSAGQVQAAPTQTIRTAAKPSFDCTKASTGPERLICSDPDLAALDVKLMADYRDLISDNHPGAACPECKAKNVAEQRAWIRNVRNACSSAACMGAAYKKRIKDIEGKLDAEYQD